MSAYSSRFTGSPVAITLKAYDELRCRKECFVYILCLGQTGILTCADGWDKKFGLYGWDHNDPDNKRVLHETSKVLPSLQFAAPRRRSSVLHLHG